MSQENMSQRDFIYSMTVKGYAVFRNVLNKDTREGILKTISSLPEEAYHNTTVVNLFDKLPVEYVRDVIENETILPKLDSLLGDTFTIYSFNSSPLHPGVKNLAGNFHRDSGRYILGYDYCFCVLYAITDFTRINGVTKVVPGSHILDEKPPDTYIAENTVDLEFSAGDALIFNGNLFHAQGENRSDKLRLQVTTTCKRSFIKQQFDFPRTLSSDFVNKLSERGRQLLGFYTRVPVTMEEFTLPGEERLYRAGQG